MPHINAMEMCSRYFVILKLMARDEGATVTEISKETGLDRWTLKSMIDRMDKYSEDGKELLIEELPNEKDKRETRFHIVKDQLWALNIPGTNLTEEESALMSFMFIQAGCSPVFKGTAEKLKKKLGMFRNADKYEVMNVYTAKKIPTKNTKQIMLEILKAIHDNNCIKINYKPVRRDITEYQLIPLCIFKYDGGYYLSAQKLPDGEYRIFGLERVQNIPSVIDYTDTLPPKVDYQKKFNDPFGPFGHIEEFEAVMKFDSFNGFFNLEKNWPDAVKIEVQPDESVIMTARTCSTIGIKKWLLSFGSGVEVLEPKWLRDEIKEEHKKATGVYKKSQRTDCLLSHSNRCSKQIPSTEKSKFEKEE